MSENVANIEDVQRFLDDFHLKTKIFDIVFIDSRHKNLKSLLALEISASRRKEIIAGLRAGDYSEGPLPDTLHHISEMWVFGKKIKKQEIYIKISMGRPGSNTICISFHIAEKSMKFPFKTKTT
ncbi:MAG: hypothetical protein H6Q20_425 [Bacteroidetes bacterium]|nr:hypothetical protein [Bacteroidota bacterium]